MRKKRIVLSCILSLLLIFTIINPCIACNNTRCNQPTLNVALYGYVPDPESFKSAVEERWSAVKPNVKLNFVDWDCYDSDPPEDLDVFVFDSIFLSHFVDSGQLLPIPSNKISRKRDILKFALDGCTVDGSIYAIPQIVCTNLLYSRKDDLQLYNTNTVSQLYNIIGERESDDVIPGNNEGLLIDMSGRTTKVCMYLDALIDTNQMYTDYFELPDLDALNIDALKNLKKLELMAGKTQANYWPDNNDAYIRAEWFKNGKGRAYIGYTEAMCKMKDYNENIDFKMISLSDRCDIPIFYGDVVGINSSVKNTRKEKLAIKLANIISDKDTLVKAIKPKEENEHPQYLLPARNSVYYELMIDYPIYLKLLFLVNEPNNHLFKLGPNSREWLEDAKEVIPSYLSEIEL